MNDPVKEFYANYHDRIVDKRYNSSYWIRRYVHRQIHAQFLEYLKRGQRVLDAGCGEGVLSCLVAQAGVDVVGIDLSGPNVKSARKLANAWGVSATFLQGDVESLPFSDNSFDVVLSSHVLEHLPNLEKGLRELFRVTRFQALIAMPTCLNPACWILLGGDNYWKLGRRSLMAMPIGLFKMLTAVACCTDGPDEGYGNNSAVPHVWRFPWVMKRDIGKIGFVITRFEAGPFVVPYLSEYFPVWRRIQVVVDKCRAVPILRNFGYGSLAICEKERVL